MRLQRWSVACVAATMAGGLALASAQGHAAGAGAQKGPTLIEYPAKITFMDRDGDAITSDGKGAYIDGTDGVFARFQVMSDGSGNAQFLLKFAKIRNSYPRQVDYGFTTTAATGCDPNTADDPTGTTSDKGYVDFLNVGLMAVGSVKAKQGGFHTAAGTFRFHDATKPDPINPYNCGDLLVITRTSATTWTVTTDTTPGQVYYTTAGNAVYGYDPANPQNPELVGSRAQFDNDAAGSSLIGNYRMPFFAVITCSSASKCPPATVQ